MVESFYKWLKISVLAIILTSFTQKKPALHPFHVSVTEINHNAPDKTLEISCKLFTDDFEKILAKNYKTRVDLGKEEFKTAMDSLVKKYINSHLSIKANGRATRFDYLGFETDKEATYAYIEVSEVSSVSKMEIFNSILYDQFDDQLNIMHIVVGGKRQSTKLNYPDKNVELSF